MLPFNGRYLFCAFNERQLKKIIPIMTRCFIFLRQQDYKFFGENVEGWFFIVFKTKKFRISEIIREILVIRGGFKNP